MSAIRISFYGDDFTGSTDAMESLTRAGLRTILFTAPPTREQLSRYPDIDAFGVAGMTRSMPPEQMEQTLRPVFTSLRKSGAPIIHYKVCSTFDSSPQIGSIGLAIDVGAEVFNTRCVPVLVGAPSLGRYCVFGNLFARFGVEPEAHRLDRHPSISKHPVTPMNEADLRLHLAKQTRKKIGLLDILHIEQGDDHAAKQMDTLALSYEVVLIDMLYEHHLRTAGFILTRQAELTKPLFVVGSSGVESALAAYWNRPARAFEKPKEAGPIIAVCGSCSPVTIRQIQWATENGFTNVPLDVEINTIDRATMSLRMGRSVVVHSSAQNRVSEEGVREIGPKLGKILRGALQETHVKRVIVAGGDTSGQIACELGIESMEMIAELTRGSPLCKVTAPGSPADGIEMTFKGGQIGPVDFFGMVQRGK